MSAAVAGWSALLPVVAGFGLAWRAFLRARDGQALAWLLAAAFALRLLPALDGYLHPWDERYHALVGKNLIAHPLTPTLYDDPLLRYDRFDWLSGHVWLHKPPLGLWLIALSLRVLGPSELAVRVPSILLGTLAVGLTLAIGCRLFDRRVAFLAAFLHAINGYLVELAAGRAPTDHVDTVFFFMLEAGVLLAIRAAARPEVGMDLLGVGAFMGLAVLTKWLPGLLLAPLWLALAFDRRAPGRLAAQLALLLGVCATIAVPWQLYVERAFPLEAAWERDYHVRHAFEALEGHAGSVTGYLLDMPRSFGELVYIPLVYFLLRACGRESTPGRRAVALWWALPYAGFSLMATQMPAYVMVAAPAVFLMVAVFFWRLRDALPSRRPARYAALALLALFVALPIRYGFERLKPWQGFARREPWAEALDALGGRFPGVRVVLFGTERPIEAMFYTGFVAYAPLPDAATLAHVASRGYRVLVVDGERVGPELRSDPRVTIVAGPGL